MRGQQQRSGYGTLRRAALLALLVLSASTVACAETQPQGAASPTSDSAGRAKVQGKKVAQTETSGKTRSPANRKKPAEQQGGDGAAVPEHPFPQHPKAPSLDGGVGWINTAGPLDIKDLRGKFVVLDFWTYCCINCMHVLPELKKLEKAYPNEVVVIGIHSAKFDAEQDSKNIEEAVLRYEIEHPVVNDANHAIWNRYGTSSWPTLLIIDPEGNAVFLNQGETKFEVLDEVIRKGLPYYTAKGVLDKRPIRFELARYSADKTPLRFPGKVLADEKGDRLFISDSNHNRIVVTTLDGSLVTTIGSGVEGLQDGEFATATLNHPQGTFLHGNTLYIADTESHALRKADMEKKQLITVAGTGKQGQGWPGLEEMRFAPLDRANLPDRWVGPPRQTKLNSPWALWVHGADLYIAMAGPHQIWKMPLDESEIGPYAGNGREDIVDGPLLPRQPYQPGFSSFAQPSGLASDGKVLFVADSEGSSIRSVPFDPKKEVRTLIGTAGMLGARLFTFGDVDGKGRKARLQHPLGVAFHEGQLYVADTYNHKIKVIHPKELTCTTIAGGKEEFNEPAGISAAAGKLYVADTNHHRIQTIDLKNGNKVETLELKGLDAPKSEAPASAKPDFASAAQVSVQETQVKPVDSSVSLRVDLQLPEGYKINPTAPMHYYVEASGDQGVVKRESIGKVEKVEKPATSFEVKLPVSSSEGRDAVKLYISAYYCQDGAEGVCRATSVLWTVPLKVSSTAQQTSLKLSHAVEDEGA